MITRDDLLNLTKSINNKVAQYAMQFSLTFHFSEDRVNDARNNPPINLHELEDLFDRFISTHIMAVVALNDKDTFVIACSRTNIHIPCAVQKTTDENGGASHKNIVITIMRKSNFGAKQEDIIFKIS